MYEHTYMVEYNAIRIQKMGLHINLDLATLLHRIGNKSAE